MKHKIWLSLFFFGILGYSWCSPCEKTSIHDTAPIPVKHTIQGEIHTLTFSNVMNIPKENYPKFLQRMLQVYGEIMELELKEDTNSFILIFENSIPNIERLQDMLSKFSVRNFILIES